MTEIYSGTKRNSIISGFEKSDQNEIGHFDQFRNTLLKGAQAGGKPGILLVFRVLSFSQAGP